MGETVEWQLPCGVWRRWWSRCQEGTQRQQDGTWRQGPRREDKTRRNDGTWMAQCDTQTMMQMTWRDARGHNGNKMRNFDKLWWQDKTQWWNMMARWDVKLQATTWQRSKTWRIDAIEWRDGRTQATRHSSMTAQQPTNQCKRGQRCNNKRGSVRQGWEGREELETKVRARAEGRNIITNVKTSEFPVWGVPVLIMGPVQVMVGPVLELDRFAFGYQHSYFSSPILIRYF